MFSMFARAIAGLLVLVLVGPSVLAATCELTCATAHQDHGAPPSSESPCHEHGVPDGISVSAAPESASCHELRELPSAIVDAVTIGVLQAEPAPAFVVAPAIASPLIVGAPESRTVLDSRPSHRPLRV